MLTALPTASIIRAALWGFGQLFPFSEFFDNPGKSLIQSAKYLLSWFRIGRYQCPPRKELQDTRFATSPTRHRIAGCERSVRAVRFPETQVSMVSIALRDQLIHNILVWRAVQRESLTRQGSKAGKIRVRTGRESDRLRWEPEEKTFWMNQCSVQIWLFVDLLSNMNQELLKNSFKVRTYQWIRNVAHSIYFLTMCTVNESDNES